MVNKVGVDKILTQEEQDAAKMVFAPTDAAFANLAGPIKEAINNTDTLIDVLRYHISKEIVLSTDLTCGASVEMIDGSTTTSLCGANDKVFQVGKGVSPGVNSFPEIIVTDVETCFGVVHVIDQVLIPP